MEQNVSTQLTSSRLCDIGVVVKDLVQVSRSAAGNKGLQIDV